MLEVTEVDISTHVDLNFGAESTPRFAGEVAEIVLACDAANAGAGEYVEENANEILTQNG